MRWDTKTLGIAVAVIIALAAAGYLVARGGPALGQSFSVGYVDLQKALDAHPRKASAEAALRDYAQAEIADAQARMKTMTPVQKQDVQKQVDQDIFKKRSELLGGLDKDIRAAVETVAKQQSFTIVLSRDVVLYGGVDLTDQVIKVIAGK